MTDQRARAMALAGSHYSCEDSWYSCPLSADGCSDDRQEGCTCGYDNRVDKIAMALADERRRVWEEAAKLMCSYCNDPQWPRSSIVQGQAVHVGPITGSLFPCNAMQIHAAIRKAHAGQEG